MPLLQFGQLAGELAALAVQLHLPTAVALAGIREARQLRFERAHLVGESRGHSHFVQKASTALFVFRANLIELCGQRRQRSLVIGQVETGLSMPLLGLGGGLERRLHLPFHVSHTQVQRGHVLPVPGCLHFEIANVSPFVLDRRFERGQPLAVFGHAGFARANLTVDVGNFRFQLERAGLDGFRLGGGRVRLISQRCNLRLDCGQSLR